MDWLQVFGVIALIALGTATIFGAFWLIENIFMTRDALEFLGEQNRKETGFSRDEFRKLHCRIEALEKSNGKEA